MSFRNFTDSAGTEWQVWDIVPGKRVRHTLADGWLTFESAAEKRRLAPIPLYWVSADDAELERMLRSAVPVQARKAEGRDDELSADADGGGEAPPP